MTAKVGDLVEAGRCSRCGEWEPCRAECDRCTATGCVFEFYWFEDPDSNETLATCSLDCTSLLDSHIVETLWMVPVRYPNGDPVVQRGV